MCPSSGELTVSMRHWYFSLCTGGCLVCMSGPAKCTLFLSIFISNSLHVSGNYVSIIRRAYSIYATIFIYLFQLLYMFRATMCPLSRQLTVVYATIFIYLFQLLYMFRATMCPLSGQLTVVYPTICRML